MPQSCTQMIQDFRMRYIVEFDLSEIPEHQRSRVVAAALRDVARRVEDHDFRSDGMDSTVRSGYDPDGVLGYHGYATNPEGVDAMRDGRQPTLGASPGERAAMRAQARVERLSFEGMLTADDEDDVVHDLGPADGFGRLMARLEAEAAAAGEKAGPDDEVDDVEETTAFRP